MKALTWIACLLLVAMAAQGADKARYSLLNPVPRSAMRPMETDRPDTTESAYTVDAGHFQFEGSVVDFTEDDDGEALVFADCNLKVGLTNTTDLQLVIPFFEREQTSGGDDSGIGDLTVRFKWNLWGNDDGPTALALMPFVKAPTAGHDLSSESAEGGLIVPFAASLVGNLGLGLMAEFDLVHDDPTGSWDVEVVNTIALGIDWGDAWGSFVEFVSVAHTGDLPWTGYANAGVTLGVSEDLVIDAGVRLGINEAADDFGVFAGFSFRR